MKKNLLYLLILHLVSQIAFGQITAPAIRANFGIDADLRANYFNGAFQAGNDDWFRMPGLGTGNFVIDTTGAAAIVARYAVDPAFRRLPFYRMMRFPAYTVVNNRLLIDAVYTRDYHGDDSTIFASGSNKNGMSPISWSCPVAQSVPDKNEILDMMCHVRRAGPNTTDSLWLIGGVSIENTTGNRYFDFEMYQTDIYYDRASRQFYGYGPDAGHTSWKFDAAGNITQPGDIIFTAEYSSSSLTLVEARVWVKKTDWQTIAPKAFNWSGLFDGDGSGAVYGYASITPNTAGAFYTGLQSLNNTWTGPFSLVLGDNSVVTTYTARQFMEFSVNLSQLGLDPVTLLGGNACGMPFRRILVKSRASTSFTSELKDFIGPFDFFLAPKANVATNAPYICDTGSVSNLFVTNPVSTSTYIWSTANGVISGSNTGSSINVTSPGTYIVTQYLQSGCSTYATDTLQVLPFSNCVVLQNNLTDFN
ncbi:MAG: type sorting protein, partial [Chitinophagaceae bacterium]|nr:type sorting protein [Chitinophagaceae bacterium]